MSSLKLSDKLFDSKGGNSQESDSELLGLDLGCKARNQLSEKDQAVHHWYRFVLSFPPHLVRHYLKRFSVTAKTIVLDPFTGTGTTLVEAQKLGIPVQGIEANPMAHFASNVKLNWSASPQILQESDSADCHSRATGAGPIAKFSTGFANGGCSPPTQKCH